MNLGVPRQVHYPETIKANISIVILHVQISVPRVHSETNTSIEKTCVKTLITINIKLVYIGIGFLHLGTLTRDIFCQLVKMYNASALS